MGIQFTSNPQQAFKRLFNDDVMYYANSRLQAYCDPYVPRRYGDLSQDVTITKDSVTYNRKYAKRNYNGKDFNFSKDQHPLATAEWNKAMAAAKGQQLADDISDYIKKR